MPRERVRLIDRALWGLLLAVALSVLGAARALTPSPSGLGTHGQLGLPPCGLLLLTGVPCPACGLTTAFAHLAHFDLLGALGANPMGLPLFVGTVAFVPFSIHALWRGRTVLTAIESTQADKWALRFVFATLAVWAARLVRLAA